MKPFKIIFLSILFALMNGCNKRAAFRSVDGPWELKTNDQKFVNQQINWSGIDFIHVSEAICGGEDGKSVYNKCVSILEDVNKTKALSILDVNVDKNNRLRSILWRHKGESGKNVTQLFTLSPEGELHIENDIPGSPK